jgi:hypothetical protein
LPLAALLLVVPLVKPLAKMLREAWIARGRPTEGKVCPPRQHSPSGMLQLGGIQRRVGREWGELGLEPIGLHESRHTAATWLDHAGVSPKVASTLMCHKTPEYQPGAASITLRRYTHTLPGGWSGLAICSTSSSPHVPGRPGGRRRDVRCSFPRRFPRRRTSEDRRCGAKRRLA